MAKKTSAPPEPRFTPVGIAWAAKTYAMGSGPLAAASS